MIPSSVFPYFLALRFWVFNVDEFICLFSDWLSETTVVKLVETLVWGSQSFFIIFLVFFKFFSFSKDSFPIFSSQIFLYNSVDLENWTLTFALWLSELIEYLYKYNINIEETLSDISSDSSNKFLFFFLYFLLNLFHLLFTISSSSIFISLSRSTFLCFWTIYFKHNLVQKNKCAINYLFFNLNISYQLNKVNRLRQRLTSLLLLEQKHLWFLTRNRPVCLSELGVRQIILFHRY